MRLRGVGGGVRGPGGGAPVAGSAGQCRASPRRGVQRTGPGGREPPWGRGRATRGARPGYRCGRLSSPTVVPEDGRRSGAGDVPRGGRAGLSRGQRIAVRAPGVGCGAAGAAASRGEGGPQARVSDVHPVPRVARAALGVVRGTGASPEYPSRQAHRRADQGQTPGLAGAVRPAPASGRAGHEPERPAVGGRGAWGDARPRCAHPGPPRDGKDSHAAQPPERFVRRQAYWRFVRAPGARTLLARGGFGDVQRVGEPVGPATDRRIRPWRGRI